MIIITPPVTIAAVRVIGLLMVRVNRPIVNGVFGFPVISGACFSCSHVSDMVGDPMHNLLVAVFAFVMLYIL